MINKEKLLDFMVVIIAIIYLIGLWWSPSLVGNRYS